MDGQNYLGIYLSKDAATVVCLNGHGREHKLLNCFSVSIEEQEGAGIEQLTALVARECADKGLEFSETTIALDCSMFMQHKVHSSFSDPKQVETTIRFDTEETLAVDIAEVAIAFDVVSTSESGAELNVFTVDKRILSDIILSLQSNNIDPVAIEPDISCLSKFVHQEVSLPEGSSGFLVILSDRNGYFLLSSESHKQCLVRTFLRSSSKDADKLLLREVTMTKATIETEGRIEQLCVYDSSELAGGETLGDKLGIKVDRFNIYEPLTDMANCRNLVEFAIAYGAALVHLKKTRHINFRNDYMPYEGKKVRMQKALKFFSISVITLLLVLGLYSQLKLSQKNKPLNERRDEIRKLYSEVMYGRKAPPKIKNAVKELGKELKQIRAIKSGQMNVVGKESVATKLTLLFKAFNECAQQTSLSIDSVSITSKSITITGSTGGSGNKNTLAVFDTIKKNQFKIDKQRFSSKAGRDNFDVTVEPQR
ncbi:MAG: hypothetical protein ACYSSI_14205 [Planctomycetota bacterium]